MGVMAIILLIAGVVVFAASFLLPERLETPQESRKLAEEEIRTMVSREMDGVKGHVDGVVEETVTNAMEKTERSLERLSNEKIMAVNEYSDTVLQEIHKNHEEVMFLYDMLNNKQTSLKNAVSQIDQAVKKTVEAAKGAEAAAKGAEETAKGAEATAKGAEETAKEAAQIAKEAAENAKEAEDVVHSFQRLDVEEAAAPPKEPVLEVPRPKPGAVQPPVEILQPPASDVDISFTQETEGAGRNCNEKILQLYQAGKSKVSIAKELGLGVGEVKLVIDLYKNL